MALAAAPTAILMAAENGDGGMALGTAAMRTIAGAAVGLRTGAGLAVAGDLLTPMALTGAGPGMVALGGLLSSQHPFVPCFPLSALFNCLPGLQCGMCS